MVKNRLYCRNGVLKMNDLFDKKVTVISLSILLAIFLWLYVITEQNPVIFKDLNLPVRLTNMDSLLNNNLVLLDDESFSVLIKLKGNKNYLDGLNKTTVYASVDLKSVNVSGPKELLIELNGIPAGVDVTWISSNRLTLNIDNIVSGVIPVSLRIDGSTAPGTAMMAPVINPAEITIRGAETVLGLIKKAEIRLDLGNQSSGINKKVDVMVLDKQDEVIEDLDINPKQVDVVIPIENTKTVAINADYKIIPAEGYVTTNVALNPGTVNVVGKKEALAGLSSVATIRIEHSDAKGNIEEKVVLALPDGIELVNKYEEIIFTANIERVGEKTVESNKIGIKNLPEGMDIEMLQVFVKATVGGPESFVNAWDISNAFYVDLDGLGEGTHNLPILYLIPDQVELKELFPEEIKVTLKKTE